MKSEFCFPFTLFENEKWNENELRSRSRMKSEMKMPRDRDREVKILENSREILENPEFFIFPLYVFKCLLKLHTWGNADLHWLHLVELLHCKFQMCPQFTYLSVNIQMCPQIACLKGCKATLTTFLFDLSPLFFSSVSSNLHS